MRTYLKESTEVFQIRNEDIEVTAMFRFNQETDQIVFDEELDNQAINAAFTIFRQKNHILNQEAIKAIREKYQLSQRAFAKLLGWSPATIARYERGAMPTKSNNAILINLRDDESLANSLLIQNQNEMSADERASLTERLQVLEGQSKGNDLVMLIESRFEQEGISIMSGYQRFNFERLKQMILYFANKIDYLSKTKLNKLLFYADFLNFEKTTVSISGLTYMHDYYGPVPKQSELIYSALEEKGAFERRPFVNGQGEQIVAQEPFAAVNFSEQELDILNRVVTRFKNDKAAEISQKPHEEMAYLETAMKEDISYSLAKDLKYID